MFAYPCHSEEALTAPAVRRPKNLCICSRAPLVHDDFQDEGVMLNRFSGEASGVHCHNLSPHRIPGWRTSGKMPNLQAAGEPARRAKQLLAQDVSPG